MAFADPQVIDIGDEFTLYLVKREPTKSLYKSDSGEVELEIAHYYAKRNRHVFKLIRSDVMPDYINPDQNVPFQTSVYLTIDEPIWPGADNQSMELAQGLIAFLATSSHAALAKLQRGEL
jgi:hypothetical protein